MAWEKEAHGNNLVIARTFLLDFYVARHSEALNTLLTTFILCQKSTKGVIIAAQDEQ